MLYGAVIGDVLGSTFEFNNWLKSPEELTIFPPNAHPTDDSVLTCAVADALIASAVHGDTSENTLRVDLVQFQRKVGGALRDWGCAFPKAGYGGQTNTNAAAELSVWDPATAAGPVLQPILFDELLKSFSGKAEKRVAAVLKTPQPAEALALGAPLGKLRSREELKVGLLAAEEKAPALFEQAMLAVSCGPLHTKIAQNVAGFHAADADEEREAALLALAELAKDISKSRVPELLAGIWHCGLFSPDGRLTLFGRRTYQHFLHLGFLDFDLSALCPDLQLDNEAGDLTKRPDTADSAEKSEAAAPESDSAQPDLAQADEKERSEAPQPYGTLAVRQLLLRWIIEHIDSDAESRIIGLLKSKTLRGSPITRGVRITRVRGNNALMKRILSADRSDPGLISVLRLAIGEKMFERCSALYPSFAQGRFFGPQ